MKNQIIEKEKLLREFTEGLNRYSRNKYVWPANKLEVLNKYNLELARKIDKI